MVLQKQVKQAMKERDGAYVSEKVQGGEPTLAENAVVQAWSWIGEQGAVRGSRLCFDEAGHPRYI